MDTGNGNLEAISEGKYQELKDKNVSGIFTQGKILQIKGSKFEVSFITKEGLQLRILPS